MEIAVHHPQPQILIRFQSFICYTVRVLTIAYIILYWTISGKLAKLYYWKTHLGQIIEIS